MPNHLAKLARRARLIARRYTLETWLELVCHPLEETWHRLANRELAAFATGT